MTPPQPEPDVDLVEDSETYADCALRPGQDYAVTAVAAIDGEVRAVYFAVSIGGEDGGVLLAPADARRQAAALLNAADAVEGFQPLWALGDEA